MLEEFEGQAFIRFVCGRKLQGDAHEVKAEHAHPTSCVRLFEYSPARQLFAAVNDGDVVETEETTLENVVSRAVDLVHPPSEVDQELVKTLFKEFAIADS